MKIEIELDDILAGREGETLSDKIRDEITDQVMSKVCDGVNKAISHHADSLVSQQVQKTLAELMPKVLDHEFKETNAWGQTENKTWTVRNRILAAISKSCVYKGDAKWESDKNSFTKALDSVVESRLNAMKIDITKKLDLMFVDECVDTAIKRLKEKLNINVA